jgi:hypothetical protein
MPIKNPVITQILQAGPKLHLEWLRIASDGYIHLILGIKPFPAAVIPTRWRSRAEDDALLGVRFLSEPFALDVPADRLQGSIVEIEGGIFRFLDAVTGQSLWRATVLRLLDQDGQPYEYDGIDWGIVPFGPARPPRSRLYPRHASIVETLPLTSILTSGRQFYIGQIVFEGSSCHLCLEARSMPEEIPPSWHLEGYDSLQVRMSFRGIGRIQLEEVPRWANVIITDRHLHLFDGETGNRQLRLAYNGMRTSILPYKTTGIGMDDPSWL